MAWYVSRNGETMGPVDGELVRAWAKNGYHDMYVRDDSGGNWMPIAQSPFSQFVHVTAGKHPESQSYTLLAFLLPLIGFIAGLLKLAGNDLDKKLGVRTIVLSIVFGIFWYIVFSLVM